MLPLADCRSLVLLADFLEDDEVFRLTLVAARDQTCKTLRRKLLSVASVEIRLLKARARTAEDCLKFVLFQRPAKTLPAFEFPIWWAPMTPLAPLSTSLQSPGARPLTGLLRVARLRKADKKLHRLDKKLAQLEQIAPVEVIAALTRSRTTTLTSAGCSPRPRSPASSPCRQTLRRTPSRWPPST